jgi:hypothetical protein
MRRVRQALVAVGLLVLATTGAVLETVHAQADSVLHRYVGVETCEVCHSSSRIGRQFFSWAKSPHARAYKDLASPEALRIAARLHIADPSRDRRCLSCHVTAYNKPLPEVLSTFRMTDGVQCETCHGPGEDYAHFSVMISPRKSILAGLVAHPDENTCKTCHNPSSPTYKGFDYHRAVSEIAHPVPPEYKKETLETGGNR